MNGLQYHVLSERPRDLSMEQILHNQLAGWAQEQVDRDIAVRGLRATVGLLPYNPEKFPEQRIDVVGSTLKPHWLRDHLPEDVLMLHMSRRLGKKLGATSLFGSLLLASRFVGGFHERPSLSSPTKLEQIRGLLETGGHVGLVCSHLDGDDVAVALGGLQIALGDRNMLARSFVPVNKLHTRESRDSGDPATAQMTSFTNVSWTIPQTANAEKHGLLDRDGAGVVVMSDGLKYLNSILRNNDVGRILSIAPTGTGITEPDGEGVRHMLEISAATFKVIAKLQAYLPVSIHHDEGGRRRWLFGDVILVEGASAKEKAENIRNTLPGLLCGQVEELTKNTTIYDGQLAT